MRKGFFLTIISLVFVSAFWISIPTGCANMIPPSGGPRDTIPPVLVKAIPGDSTTNFKSDRIVLNFNEELDDPKDPRTNIIYTPSFDVDPEVTTKGKSLTVKFKDSMLSPNTTYVINFGNAIVDITEANAAKNFIYTFSTGPYLDSLEISGKVLLAENGGVDSSLNVVLYKNLADSIIKSKTPQYVVRLDRNGNFRFHNLPKDTFAIYVFGGVNARRYNDRELFAFADTTVIAGEADSVLLYAYRPEQPNAKTSLTIGTAKISNNDRRLRFTPSTTGQQELLSDFTLSFPVPLKAFDSTKMHLSTDSIFNPVNFTASLDSTKKEVRLKTEWQEATTYHLIVEKDFATDTVGRQLLKTDTLTFITRRKTDYGSLLLKFKNLNKYQHPVLEFVQNNQVIKSVPLTSVNYGEALFVPGEFTLRIFDDVNENGKWDTGNFFGKKRQPEIIHPIERPFTIKANWDNEFEVVL